MENEAELGKDPGHTDGGFSEKKLALNVDRDIKSKQSPKSGNVFTPQKKSQTVFQAQKEEKK